MTTTTKTRKTAATTTDGPTVSEALALVKQRESEQAERLDAEAALDVRLENGDDTVTAEDLTAAASAVKRAGLLLSAAHKALTKARDDASRAAAQASPDIAEMLHRLITENVIELGLYGVPVVIVKNFRTDLDEVTAPSIVLYQSRETTKDTHYGTIGGECFVGFVTSPQARLNVNGDVMHRIKALAVQTKGAGQLDRFSPGFAVKEIREGVELTVSGFTVKGSFPDVPTVAAVPSDRLMGTFAARVVGAVRNGAGTLTQRGVVIGNGDSAALVSNVRCETSSSRLASTREENGTIRRTVEVEVVAGAKGIDSNEMHQRVSLVLGQFVGEFVAGMGRIEAVDSAKGEPLQGGVRKVTAQFVFASQAPAA